MGAIENVEESDERSTDVERDGKQGKEVESDYEPARDSVSSQGEANNSEDTRAKRVSRVPKKLVKNESKENSPRSGRISSNRKPHIKLQYIPSNNLQNKSPKPNKAANGAKTLELTKPETVTVSSCPSSEVSEEMDDKAVEDDKSSIEDVADDKATEGKACDDKATEGKATDDKAFKNRDADDTTIEGVTTDDKAFERRDADETTIEGRGTDDRSIEGTTDDKTIAGTATDEKAIESIAADDKPSEEAKEIDILDEAPNCDQSTGTDEEIADTEETIPYDDKSTVHEKNEELESKCERLEQELREVAALEISLYSVVPEHGCSSHKLHTPARRLSRLYVHASKFWSSDKKASVTKNFVSGLVLVAKSCGNDVSRLTFWLSNTVVLREIIVQTFGISRQPNLAMKAFSTNGNAKMLGKNSLRRKNNYNGKHSRPAIWPIPDDWRETGTLVAALEKIESWIFSRIVESVWWQALTPHMQTLVEDISSPKAESLLGPALGDPQQGNLSIHLWRTAFQDAFNRICPLRAGGHECGCLPVLAKLVMEHCVARLDVAMFNAVLRESANEIPSDPISDPIVDSRVLPIPAGDFSFGSGAQLKNSIGNWSRWLQDNFGMVSAAPETHGQVGDENDDRRDAAGLSTFKLLNELSDLLMLPKDMLLEKSIRKEVCPSIGIPLVTRILCNFTPDEFCPEPVPGMVLEELNAESLLERFTEKDVITTFPCTASPVVYCPPSPEDVAKKVADAGGNAEPEIRASMVQMRGYTSDDDLDDLDNPLTSLYDRSAPPSPCNGVSRSSALQGGSMANARYQLLREVWSEGPSFSDR
uniref:Dilute domain-containing protein n=1 Tax=Leersia perrieri TaxID=77586 RepID=A0A0D9XF20_9ORYZ